MPFVKLQFKQGVNRDQTNYTGEGGWWDCDKIRFFSGYPQKIGGWTKYTVQTFIGVCRQMFNWITSFGDNFLALGTDAKVYIEVGAVFYDITPVRDPIAVPPGAPGDEEFTFIDPITDNCISASIADGTTVTVTINGHGCLTGDYVVISGVTGDPGGIPNAEINADHVVTKIDNDNFSFVVSTAATSNDPLTGGTAIKIACLIHTGNPASTAGYGWGTGVWNGNFGWGLASPTPIYLPQRDWFFTNFNNSLIMNIRASTAAGGGASGGPIYYWERINVASPVSSLNKRAALLSTVATTNGFDGTAVPDNTTQVLLSQNDRHLLAFGANAYLTSDFNPLLIRWASQDNPFDWVPDPLNTAGDILVSRGSKIVRAIPNRQEILVFTDASLYSLQFTGTTDVFSLQELADNISIISSRAVSTANNVSFWMGIDKFYVYDGKVNTLPTTVRDYVYRNLNFNQAEQIISGTNEGYNEIWWFYPSANSNWNDKYVIFNYLDKCWYFGNLERTAWLDTSLRPYPFAATTPAYEFIDGANSGVLYQHEVGVNDDQLPMESYIQSSDFDIEDGEKFMLTRRMIPDINFKGSTAAQPEVDLTIRPRNFPGSAYAGDASDTQRVIETSVDIYTNQVFMRARARQMAFKIASDQLGVQWQLGSPRIEARPDGKQ